MKYSQERKQAVLAKLVPPHQRAVKSARRCNCQNLGRTPSRRIRIWPNKHIHHNITQKLAKLPYIEYDF